MADEDYGDDDTFFFDDDDYLYVEDDYAIAVSLHGMLILIIHSFSLEPGCQPSGKLHVAHASALLDGRHTEKGSLHTMYTTRCD